MTNIKTVSSEHPLVVFVSSVMNDELNEARKIVKETIEEFSYIKPWLFEYTPAGTSSVEETYLQKVKNADYVIWLIGSYTTDPVAKEIKECIASKKDNLLIFKLPSYVQHSLTQELIEILGNSCKWKKVESIDLLANEVNLAIGDEIVKAVRSNNYSIKLSLNEIVNEKIQQAKENILIQWITLGLSNEIAEQFFNDDTVGIVRPEYLPNSENPVRILCGDLGSGKSLIAARYYYKELLKFKFDINHPIPVYLKANSAVSNLKNAIDMEISIFKDLTTSGKTIIIDGLDEISFKSANQLLEESISISRLKNNMKFLITTRYLPNLFSIDKSIIIELLSNNEIGNIFDIICGTDYQIRQFGKPMNFDREWNISIKEAIKRPLFAILLAKNIDKNKNYYNISIIDIIQKLIREILIKDDFDSQIEKLLVELAVKLIEKPFKRINENDLNLSHSELIYLQRSHFIYYENNYFSFKISLFLEWFACQKLLKNDDFIIHLIDQNKNLANWRFPFTLFISTTSFEVASKLLLPLIENNIAYAGSLIANSLNKSTLTESYHYTEDIVKKQVQFVFEYWLKVLNPELSSLIAPVNENGDLGQYEIKIESNQFKIIWLRENSNNNQDIINNHIFLLEPENFISAFMNTISNKPDAWIWYYSYNYLRNKLEESLKDELLYIDEGVLSEEKIWTSALAMRNLHNSHNLVPVSIIEKRFPQGMFGKLSTPIFNKRRTIDLDWFNMKIEILKGNNIIEISDPHPKPTKILEEFDRPWNYFKNFDSEQLFYRITHIFKTAIIGYQELVEKYFNSFKENMRIYSMLPIFIRGSIVKDKFRTPDNSVQIKYYFDVLPDGHNNKVEFEMINYSESKYDQDKSDKIFSEIRENILKFRQDKLYIIQGGSYFTDSINPIIPDPATRLIYNWLWDDLERISWVHGSYSDWRNR